MILFNKTHSECPSTTVITIIAGEGEAGRGEGEKKKKAEARCATITHVKGLTSP